MEPMRTYRDVHTGDVYIEANVTIRVAYNTTLYTDNETEYLLEGICNGDLEMIGAPSISKFEINNIETEIEDEE